MTETGSKRPFVVVGIVVLLLILACCGVGAGALWWQVREIESLPESERAEAIAAKLGIDLQREIARSRAAMAALTDGRLDEFRAMGTAEFQAAGTSGIEAQLAAVESELGPYRSMFVTHFSHETKNDASGGRTQYVLTCKAEFERGVGTVRVELLPQADDTLLLEALSISSGHSESTDDE